MKNYVSSKIKQSKKETFHYQIENSCHDVKETWAALNQLLLRKRSGNSITCIKMRKEIYSTQKLLLKNQMSTLSAWDHLLQKTFILQIIVLTRL